MRSIARVIYKNILFKKGRSVIGYEFKRFTNKEVVLTVSEKQLDVLLIAMATQEQLCKKSRVLLLSMMKLYHI